MSCFDDGDYDKEESFQCECGGNITQWQGEWICSRCNAIQGFPPKDHDNWVGAQSGFNNINTGEFMDTESFLDQWNA